MLRFRRAARNGAHRRVLIDAQPRRDGGCKFQRVKLRLLRKAHRARHRKRQRQLLRERGMEAQRIERAQLVVDLFALAARINIGVARLKIAVDVRTHLPVALQRREIRVQIPLRLFFPEFTDEFIINEPVLRRDLRRRILRHAAAERVRLRERAVHARVGQQPRAQQARHSAADHQHIRARIAAQRLKLR